MRKLLLTASIAAVALPALPAAAQSTPRQENRDYNREGDREDRRDNSTAGSRDDARDSRQGDRENYRDARQDRRQDRRGDRRADRGQDQRDWRQYRNYDYNRPERGQGAYYADRYYREGSNYQTRRLGANDRIYRGRDNRYYCRRNDGTTGLIIGGLSGGLLGNVIAGGGSRTLGTLLGGTAGALLGRSVDRNNVTCR